MIISAMLCRLLIGLLEKRRCSAPLGVVFMTAHALFIINDISYLQQLPAAAELPPLSKMKDVQEAPSYPPVRFRTNIEPEAPTTERLPPIFKNTSLIGRPLPVCITMSKKQMCFSIKPLRWRAPHPPPRH